MLKPALALVLIIGVNMLSRPSGLSGLLAAAGVLLVALFCPFALYRLLAFVDPGTNAGMTARGFLNTSGLSGGGSGGGAGGGSGSDGSGGGDGGEAAHAARFDAAGGGSSGGAGTGGAGAGGAGAGAGGGGAAAAGAGAAGVIAGVGAAVAAAGQFASQYANQTMDASGIGHPHGGRGGAPTAARGGSDQGGGSPSGGAGSGGPDDNGPDTSSTLATAPEYGDHDDFLRIRASTPTTTTTRALATDRVTATTPVIRRCCRPTPPPPARPRAGQAGQAGRRRAGHEQHVDVAGKAADLPRPEQSRTDRLGVGRDPDAGLRLRRACRARADRAGRRGLPAGAGLAGDQRAAGHAGRGPGARAARAALAR